MSKRENQEELIRNMTGIYNFMKEYFRYQRRNDERNMDIYLIAAQMSVDDITELLQEHEGNLLRMPRRRR